MMRKKTAKSRYLLTMVLITIGIFLASHLLVKSAYAHELTDVKNPALKIFNEKYEQAGKVNSCDNHSFGTGSPFNIQFDYEDPTGQVTNASKIAVAHSGRVEESVEGSHEVALTEKYPLMTRSGDNFKGTIKMQWCVTFQGRNSTSAMFQLKNAKGELSNKTLTIKITRPEGAL